MGTLLKKVIIALALVIGAFFIGILAFNFLLMPRFVRSGKEVKVPEVIGKSLEEAESILSQARLNHHVQSQIYDPLIPEGFVARQTPTSGKKVKEGKRVYLVISSGPQFVKVPELKGVRLEQAERLINLVGLRAGQVLWIHSDAVPEGNVIASNPASGKQLELGEEIDLILSKGEEKETFPMPSLVGLSVLEAKAIVETKGLVLGEVKPIETEGVEKNVVLLQGPQPGELVQAGDTVEFGVSSTLTQP